MHAMFIHKILNKIFQYQVFGIPQFEDYEYFCKALHTSGKCFKFNLKNMNVPWISLHLRNQSYSFSEL